MIVLTIVRSSSKMGIVAPVVLKKLVHMLSRCFGKIIFFFQNSTKFLNRNNKQTFRCYGNTESGPLFCTDKFFVSILDDFGQKIFFLQKHPIDICTSFFKYFQ